MELKDILLFPVTFLVKIFKFHKFKIFIFSFALVAFLISLFPYGDLADLISSNISKGTRGNVYLQFDDMNISLLPTPGVKLVEPKLAMKSGLNLKMDALEVTPSLLNLITSSISSGFKPKPEDIAAGSIMAKGLFKGDVAIDISKGKRIDDENPDHFKRVELNFENIDLSQLENLVTLPVKLKGSAQGKLNQVDIDPKFTAQPKGEIQIKIKNLKIPATTLKTDLGPLSIPTLSFKFVKLKGRLIDQELLIEEGLFGDSKDALNAQVKAKINISVLGRGGKVNVNPGRYDFKVKMNANKQIEKDLSIAFILFDKFKKPTSTGSLYMFQAKGRRLGKDTPNFSALSRL